MSHVAVSVRLCRTAARTPTHHTPSRNTSSFGALHHHEEGHTRQDAAQAIAADQPNSIYNSSVVSRISANATYTQHAAATLEHLHDPTAHRDYDRTYKEGITKTAIEH